MQMNELIKTPIHMQFYFYEKNMENDICSVIQVTRLLRHWLDKNSQLDGKKQTKDKMMIQLTAAWDEEVVSASRCNEQMEIVTSCFQKLLSR